MNYPLGLLHCAMGFLGIAGQFFWLCWYTVEEVNWQY
jgi:hypothetical protein